MTPGGATVGPAPVYPAAVVERQLKLILRSWGMPPGHVEACARAMLYADLRGIDAHGFAMLPIYDDLVREEKVVPGAEVRLGSVDISPEPVRATACR